jgi:hypothetical protein
MKVKYVIATLLLSLHFNCWAQLKIKVIHSYFDSINRQFIHDIKIENKSNLKNLIVSIQSDREAMQLPFPVSNDQITKISNGIIPITCTLFYYKNAIIDEFTMKSGHNLLNEESLFLHNGKSIHMSLKTSDFGANLLKLARNKEEIYVSILMVYRSGESIKSLVTKKTRVRY